MIVVGLIAAILGVVLHIPALWTIGILLIVVGLILVALGAFGRPVGGRRHYY